MPRVSVIIPAFNHARFLGEAIESVLNQTLHDFEIVVVDDGSTDNTSEIVASVSDPRVRYIYQTNKGLSAARNAGILNSGGPLLTFLDSDDRFLPQKLEVLTSVVDSNPHLGLVAGQALLIDESGHTLGEIFDRPLPVDSAELLLGNPLHVGSVLLRRDWLKRVGLFDESLRSYEDWDLWLRLAGAGCRMASVPRPVSLYRFHQAQMTRLGGQMTSATFAVLEKVFHSSCVPAHWSEYRDKAYSRAWLRTAAHAYTTANFQDAQQCMRAAVRLDPSLSANAGEQIVRIIAGWANHAKTLEPLVFLEGVYRHLPEELAFLRSRARFELAREALHLAAEARTNGNSEAAQRRARQAVRYRPVTLLDRRVLSLLFRPATGAIKRRP